MIHHGRFRPRDVELSRALNPRGTGAALINAAALFMFMCNSDTPWSRQTRSHMFAHVV